MESSAPAPATTLPLYVFEPVFEPGEVPIAVPDADGVVTLTPRRSTILTLSSLQFLPSVILLVTYAINFRESQGWILIALAIVLSAGIRALAIVRLRIVITPERVGVRGAFRTRWYDRASLGRLLVVRGYGRRAHAFLFGENGKRLVRLSGDLWDEPRIRAFHAALGLPTRVRQGPTTRRDLRTEEPGAIAWPEAHPVAFITIAVVGVTVALFVLVNIGIMIFVNSLMA